MGRWCGRNSFVKRRQSSDKSRISRHQVMASQSSPPPSPPSSASASPPTSNSTATLIKTTSPNNNQPQSFCIDALLRPASSPEHGASSPPSSPGSYGGSQPRGGPPALNPLQLPPGLFPPMNNPAVGNGLVYPYPGSLLTAAASVAASAAPPTSSTSVSSSLENALKNGMNMQTVQLEWLARTGMLYHRFPELAGNLKFYEKLLWEITYYILEL